MKNSGVMRSDIPTNARVKLFPNSFGEWLPYSISVFDRKVYIPDGWEKSCDTRSMFCDEEREPVNSEESRRKSYKRALNNVFDLMMCTKSFDSFVTLTFDELKIDRQDYGKIIKKLGIWLDNRVRRDYLDYILVPELHKDGKSIHFHGLMNFKSLNTVRAINNDKESPYYGKPLVDKRKRPVYNLSDFDMGFSTVIKITGKNGHEACAKYCYKYMVKSGGLKIGGRYYLSGGDLCRPKYQYLNVPIDVVPGEEIELGKNGEHGHYKNYVFKEGQTVENLLFK